MRSCVLLFAAASALLAAEHHGIVTFRGLPLPGAVVTALRDNQKLVTSTDDDGTYSFRDIPDGNWTIEVEMTGFGKVSREVAIAPGAPPPTWDLKLEAPKAAAPPAAPSAAPSTTAPPATAAAPRPPGAPPGPGGGRGAPAMTPEQAQAAARARATAQMRAMDSAQSRAAAVQATTATNGGGDSLVMSGSLGGGGGAGGASFGNAIAGNQYNGNASFTLDNSIWDATPYSLNGVQTPKPASARGRVNLSFGGPLKIPHLLKGKAGTFTINYAMGRNRNGTTADATVPTALERTGDFSQSVMRGPVTVYDPIGGAPFPGNRIPTSRLSSAALALASYYPLPNAPGSRLNYQVPLVAVSDQDNLNLRLNQTLGKNDRIFGGLGWQRFSGTNPNLFGFIDRNTNYGINVNANWAHTFNKNLVQTVNFTFSRSRSELAPFFANQRNIAADLGIQGTSSLPLNWGPPNLSFTNFTTLSDGSASLSRNQTSSVTYSMNWVRKQHNWTFGADYRRQQINPLADPNGRGSFTFTGLTTAVNGSGGYDFADFLLGLPDAASIRFGNPDKYFRTWKLDFYVNDNWNISKALSANLGLRWDYTAPYTEIYNRMANLDVAPGFGQVAVVQAGQGGQYSGGLPSSLIRGQRNAFSPNLGLAWRVFPKNPKMPTSVRLGFSQIHPLDAYGSIANSLAAQPPFARSLSVASSATNPLTLQTGFLNNTAFPNTYGVDPNYRLLCVTQAMLILIQPLPKGYYVVAGAVYAKASHLDQVYLPNSLPPGLTAPVNGPPVGFIYQQSNARLHAVVSVFQVGRNMANGLSLNASLQSARAIDNGGVAGMSGAALAQNWQNLNAEYATSALVPKMQFNGNWQYSTGQGKAGGALMKGWKGRLFKDWTFTNGLTWRAGTPLTATVGGNLATVTGTGITGTVRADATGLPIDAPEGSGQPFNLAAFAVPAPGRWGNAGRNTIWGPSVWALNGSMGRLFRLGERRSVDLRFDANNFINHVVINGWSTVVNAYNYGLPTGTQPMRTMTANLRFRF